MGDLVDEAQAHEHEMRAHAPANHSAVVIVQPLPWPRDCTRCGDPIPLGRAAALPGAGLCTVCQTELEAAR